MKKKVSKKNAFVRRAARPRGVNGAEAQMLRAVRTLSAEVLETIGRQFSQNADHSREMAQSYTLAPLRLSFLKRAEMWEAATYHVLEMAAEVRKNGAETFLAARGAKR